MVEAFDEARFGLISWHRRRALLPQRVPPAIRGEARLRVDLPLRGGGSRQRGELLRLPPARHGRRLLGGVLGAPLGEAYADHRLLVVLDGAPSHRSKEIACPENVDFLRLPRYSPELNPVERWFQEFRRVLSNKTFETVELLQEALSRALEPYWDEPARLRGLTGFPWWVEAVDAL